MEDFKRLQLHQLSIGSHHGLQLSLSLSANTLRVPPLLSPPPRALQATLRLEPSTGSSQLVFTQSASLHKSKFLLHPLQEHQSRHGFLLDGSSVMLPHTLTTSAPQPQLLALPLEPSIPPLHHKLLFQRLTSNQSLEIKPLLVQVRLLQLPLISLGEQQSGLKPACHSFARQLVTVQIPALNSLQ